MCARLYGPVSCCLPSQDKKAAVVSVVGSCLDVILTYCVEAEELLDDIAACMDPKNVRVLARRSA